jgi:hypothetical protein
MAYLRQGLGSLETVAQTIQTQEGWYPGSVAYRNNNPGNLRYPRPILGATGVDSNGFLIFPDYSAGWTALEHQISLDASRGLTIADFTAKYAPAPDSNDPASYAAKIAQAVGLSVSDPLAAALDDSSGGNNFASVFPALSDVNPWVLAGLAFLGILAASSLLSD